MESFRSLKAFMKVGSEMIATSAAAGKFVAVHKPILIRIASISGEAASLRRESIDQITALCFALLRRMIAYYEHFFFNHYFHNFMGCSVLVFIPSNHLSLFDRQGIEGREKAQNQRDGKDLSMESQLRNRVEITKAEWFAAGLKRYGFDQSKWKFRCPACGEIFEIAQWSKQKKNQNIGLALQDCPNALNIDDPDLCVWHGFGSLNPVHIKDENWFWLTTSVFDFSDDPLNGDRI